MKQTTLLLHTVFPRQQKQTWNIFIFFWSYIMHVFSVGMIQKGFFKRAQALGYTPIQITAFRLGTTGLGLFLAVFTLWAFTFAAIIKVFIFISGIVIGYILPELLLPEFEKQAALSVYAQIPFFFTLLYFALQSGTYADTLQAMSEIAHESPGSLSRLLRKSLDYRYTMSKREIYAQLKQQIKDPLFSESIETIQIQDEYGGDLAPYFEKLSQHAFTSRLLKSKEIGLKSSGLLLFPLMVFYLPIIAIILLAPAVLGFMQQL